MSSLGQRYSSDHRFGVGIVGIGGIADVHVHALRALGDRVEIVGVHARNPDRLDAFATKHGLRAISSLDELVDSDAIDVVVILTPSNARQEIIERCAAAGKHILTEKPIERTHGVALEIVEAVERAGVSMGVFFQHRFRPSVIEAERICRAAGWGRLAHASISVPWWRAQSYYDEEGRGTYARDGGGVLLIQAIHTLDVALALAGPIAEVQAQMATTLMHRMEAEDFVSANLRFEGGAPGSLLASTASFPSGEESIFLQYEGGSVSLVGTRLRASGLDGSVYEFEDPEPGDHVAGQFAMTSDHHASVVRDFLDALVEGRAPVTSGRQSLAVHRLIAGLEQSSREGRTVKL